MIVEAAHLNLISTCYNSLFESIESSSSIFIFTVLNDSLGHTNVL